MVELRKRPAPAPATEPAKKKAAPRSNAKKDDAKTAEVVAEEQPAATDIAAKEATTESKVKKSSGPASPPKKGDKIDLDAFGGEIETSSEQKVTLASLVEDSKKGVVLFTYPKASTPYVPLKSFIIFEMDLDETS
jgi:peroxiredoxin Q/BCP